MLRSIRPTRAAGTLSSPERPAEGNRRIPWTRRDGPGPLRGEVSRRRAAGGAGNELSLDAPPG